MKFLSRLSDWKFSLFLFYFLIDIKLFPLKCWNFWKSKRNSDKNFSEVFKPTSCDSVVDSSKLERIIHSKDSGKQRNSSKKKIIRTWEEKCQKIYDCSEFGDTETMNIPFCFMCCLEQLNWKFPNRLSLNNSCRHNRKAIEIFSHFDFILQLHLFYETLINSIQSSSWLSDFPRDRN